MAGSLHRASDVCCKYNASGTAKRLSEHKVHEKFTGSSVIAFPYIPVQDLGVIY